MKLLPPALLLAIALMMSGPLSATTIYVDDNAPNDPGPGDPAVSDPLEDGTADHPYDAIQEGINAATTSATVLVKDGTYTGAGNRDLDFGGKAITVTSENGPEVTIIDCEWGSRGVYFHSGETHASVLEGFTIGNGAGGSNGGGGIRCDGGSPTIVDCVIADCRATYDGGGVYLESSDAMIVNCEIEENSVTWHRGAGISCHAGDPEIVNCRITGNNVEDGDGGGIYCSPYGTPTIAGCLISGNIARDSGGGIYCSRAAIITNCTIVGNSAPNVAGVFVYDSSPTPTLTNCILWGNTTQEIAGPATLYYCDVEGAWSGAGSSNISIDPMLRSDGHLRAGSPCIDAANPTLRYDGLVDIDGEPRAYPGTADIGADEFVDADADGLPDWWEVLYLADPSADNDSDGLTNLDEYGIETDPSNPDTDGDGRSDGREMAAGTNPLHIDNNKKTYYVNGSTSDDDYDGLAPAYDGAHGPKKTIQAGIDAAVGGWDYTVLVAPGTYAGPGNRYIDLSGKALMLRSAAGAAETVIDLEGSGCGFWLCREEPPTALIDGFTVQNGSIGSLGGGGIRLIGASSPTITNCVVANCAARYSGGGVYCDDYASPTFRSCVITGNVVEWHRGGGVHCEGNSSPTFVNCVIVKNTVEEGSGGGVYCHGYSGAFCPTFVNCTIADNSAELPNAGGVDAEWPTRLVNCIVWGNSGPQIAGNPVVDYCNTSKDPRFVDGASGDYHLSLDSPCIDWCPTGPDTDIDGHYRPLDVPGVGFDGTRTYDIGADEFGSQPFPDNDGDDMDDRWEVAYGLDPTDARDATLDADEDWLLNVEEYLFGSDPQDANSPVCVYADDDAAGAPVQDGTPAHPYESIQAAIDAAAAAPPAVVKVLAGTYDEKPVMASDVWVIGSGAATTTLAPSVSGIVVSFNGANNGRLAGVTIRPQPNSVSVRSYDSTITVRDCVFTGGTNGVGINYTGSATIENCAIVGNSGYGIWAGGQAAVRVVNCTIADNGIKGAYLAGSNTVVVANTILYGNADDISVGASTPIAVSYCDIGDGDYAGSNGNIVANPLFMNAPIGDYRLMPGSPCIDAGTSDGAPSLDLLGWRRRNIVAVPDTGGGARPWHDIGAYEYAFDCDIDGDGEITIDDLILVYDGLGGTDPALDLDGDGLVTFADLRIVYEHIPPDERDFGGVSTLWVLAYTEPTDPSVEGLDPHIDQSQRDNDGDARTNYEEFVAGTDPTDPASLFAITAVTSSVALEGELFTMTWTVAPGKSYQLYASETIGPGADWQPVFGEYVIDGGTARQTVAVDSAIEQLFFKVEVW